MKGRARLDVADGLRWLLSGLVVLSAHAAAAAFIVNLADPVASGQPAAAILVDLAPIAAAPDEAPQDVAPGPLSPQVDAPPEVEPDPTAEDTPVETPVADTPVEAEPDDKPVEQKLADLKPVEEKIEPPPVEPPPQEQPVVEPAPLAPKPEVTAALPTPMPPPRPHRKPKPRKPMSLAAAPTPAPKVDERITAPAQGMPSPASRQAALSWNHMISAALERSKRYPAEAKSRNEQGTAVVAFSIDRGGRVLSSRIVRSSGSAALDQETLATVQRAQPLPPPPADHPGQRFSFSVPIRFNIR